MRAGINRHAATVEAHGLVVHADTTDAGVHEAVRTTRIHAALAAKGLAPSQHLADTAYMAPICSPRHASGTAST
jgi:hypothetical protein